MTQVTMSREGTRHTVTAKGHAKGRPDTCAGISTLMYSLYVWLINTDSAWNVSAKLDSGDAEISYETGDPGAENVWEFLLCGFLQLQADAPGAVSIRFSPALGEKSDRTA